MWPPPHTHSERNSVTGVGIGLTKIPQSIALSITLRGHTLVEQDESLKGMVISPLRVDFVSKILMHGKNTIIR